MGLGGDRCELKLIGELNNVATASCWICSFEMFTGYTMFLLLIINDSDLSIYRLLPSHHGFIIKKVNKTFLNLIDL